MPRGSRRRRGRDRDRPRVHHRYKTKLLVKLRLALPWQPVLAWPWGVEHVFEERADGSVVVTRHLESPGPRAAITSVSAKPGIGETGDYPRTGWDVSAATGVAQLFRAGPPGALTGPATKVAASKTAPSPLGTKDPIAGPLVAAARATGVLPEEEDDGWTGEPSAWADEDSFTQKLSGFTQTYLAGFRAPRRRSGRGDVAVTPRRTFHGVAAMPRRVSSSLSSRRRHVDAGSSNGSRNVSRESSTRPPSTRRSTPRSPTTPC